MPPPRCTGDHRTPTPSRGLLDGSGLQRRRRHHRLHGDLVAGRLHLHRHRGHQLHGDRADQRGRVHLHGDRHQRHGATRSPSTADLRPPAPVPGLDDVGPGHSEPRDRGCPHRVRRHHRPSARPAVVSWTAPLQRRGGHHRLHGDLEPGRRHLHHDRGTQLHGHRPDQRHRLHVHRDRHQRRLGTGPASAASASAIPATVPGAPTAVPPRRTPTPVGRVLDGTAVQRWRPLTSYTATSSPGGFTCTTPNGTTTSCTVTGLTNGTALHLHGDGHQRGRHQRRLGPVGRRPPRPPCPAPPPRSPPPPTPTPSPWCRGPLRPPTAAPPSPATRRPPHPAASPAPTRHHQLHRRRADQRHRPTPSR